MLAFVAASTLPSLQALLVSSLQIIFIAPPRGLFPPSKVKFDVMSVPDLSRVHARPLIPLLLALMAGVVGGLRLPNVPVFFWAVFSLIISSVVLLWKGKRVFLLCLSLCFLLGYWRLHSRVTAELPANHVSRFIDHKRWHMIGTVDSQPEQFADRTRFVLKAESIARKSRLPQSHRAGTCDRARACIRPRPG